MKDNSGAIKDSKLLPSAADGRGATPLGPGSLGCTFELCAGIVDKKIPLECIAQEEILEETGKCTLIWSSIDQSDHRVLANTSLQLKRHTDILFCTSICLFVTYTVINSCKFIIQVIEFLWRVWR